jgi:hypothetical protein
VIDSSSSNYRLALVDSTGESVFVAREGEALSLPCVAVPNRTRTVEQLHLAAETRWAVKAVILDILRPNQNATPIVVAEVRSSANPTRLSFVDLNEIPDETLRSDERRMLQDFLSGGYSAHGPFSRLGWIDEAKRWIKECALNRKDLLSEDIHQLNACGSFALVHFRTQVGRGYWLKATGTPNTHEFAVTWTLARTISQFLPPVLAARKDWNAWVMEDGGLSLRENLTLPALEKAVVTLASLQQQSIFWLSVLRDCGCRDRSLNSILDHLDEIMVFLEEAMARQTSSKAPRLDQGQLRHLASFLTDALARMQSLKIPDVLVHGDLNPGNILLDGKRCVFIDWAEAYLGNPFLAFEGLAAHLTTTGKQAAVWVPHLRELYKRQWLETLSSSLLERAFTLAPVLAIVACLVGRGDWLDSSRRNDPIFDAHARSLARKMYGIAREHDWSVSPCR